MGLKSSGASFELKIFVKFANLDPTGKNIFSSFEPTIENFLDDNHFEKLLLERALCF